jgi:hypothetical protein
MAVGTPSPAWSEPDHLPIPAWYDPAADLPTQAAREKALDWQAELQCARRLDYLDEQDRLLAAYHREWEWNPAYWIVAAFAIIGAAVLIYGVMPWARGQL